MLRDATADIGNRPARLVMTILGTVLGTGALVATLGFAQTAAGQIASQFNAVASTQVVIEPGTTQAGGGRTAATARLPWDAEDRVDTLAGVDAAVLLAKVNLGTDTITAVPLNDPSAAQQAPPPLVASSQGLIGVTQAHIVTGRMFDAGHVQRGDRVALLGARAAARLAINRVDSQPSIFIAGKAYAVIGIFDTPQRRVDLLDAVVIPISTAQTDFALAGADQLVIAIRPGAGPQVGAQAVVTLDPNSPDGFKVSAPQGRSELAANVSSDVNVVFLILGAVVLLAGALGIANVTTLTVLERTSEIGLRRALGGTSWQIAGQIVVESIIIGLLGGLIGASLGIVAIVAVSAVQEWTPVADPLLAVAGTVLGAVVGLIAGFIPARRAARIEPVAALRTGG